MGIDIRLPIGWLFSMFGLVLAIFGLASDKSLYGKSLGININLIWGLAMLAFAAIMLALGRTRKARS